MKTLILITSLLISSLSAEVISQELDIKLASKSFLSGDAIRIDKVFSTSEGLEVGDTVSVIGKYRLDTRKNAKLFLFLTQFEGDGLEEVDPGQRILAKEGWHNFKASITIKHKGYLHLTFYDVDSGKPFGGVYFGTNKQVEAMPKNLTAHYNKKR